MRSFFSLLLPAFLFPCFAYSQAAPPDTLRDAGALQETVIATNRMVQSRMAVAQSVQVLRRKQIERINAQTTADLLQNTGTVFVQKSQQGGGSPVLRGFEASRVLLVVDGVRLNNAIYRSGHLQNAITVDQGTLERAEVLFGPASTVYGTDALGGAVCFFTKNPVLSEKGVHTSGSAFARYGTANQEKTAHVDFSLGGRRLGSLTSFTFSDFGDLRMGKKVGTGQEFGLRVRYVERINGRDSLVLNPDPYVQRFSGYQQYDFLQKFVFQQNSRLRHGLNVQFSTSSNIPRYDRLTDEGPLGLNSAEWYYGPQQRLLAAYSLTISEAGWFNGGLRTTMSLQDITESRHNRNFRDPNRNDRTEHVQVLGLLADAMREWKRQVLHMGVDGQYNDVTSTAQRFHIETGAVSPLSTRYPDGGSQMGHLAAYATHEWRTANEQWRFSEGLRVGYSNLRAEFRDRTFFKFPFSETRQSNPVASGSVGVVWRPTQQWRVAANGSSGFRVPNVDDLGKVFDTKPGNVIVPNADIKPEKTYNLDLGMMYLLTDQVRWENSVWYTAFRDAIVTADYQFQALDSIVYDGKLSRVMANQNQRNARIWGLSSQLDVDLHKQWTVFGALTYTRGRILAQEGTTPLDHIPPLYGRAGVRWHTSRASAEFFALWNGKKKISDYLLNGEDNDQYARADGLPAWVTWNLRASVSLSRYLTVQAGVDNLLDWQYRTFSSGINAPGRHLFLTIRANW